LFDEGIVTVAGKNPAKCEEAIKLVEAITFDPEVGMEFDGKVTRLMTFGAFVEFAPGREGLVHISELEWHRVNKVEDVCGPGDSMKIKLIKIDDQGRLDFSRKALLEKPEGWTPPPKRDRSHNSRDRGRKPPNNAREVTTSANPTEVNAYLVASSGDLFNSFLPLKYLLKKCTVSSTTIPNVIAPTTAIAIPTSPTK
jgi:predicted RNA-binding protein with RPS1 domain